VTEGFLVRSDLLVFALISAQIKVKIRTRIRLFTEVCSHRVIPCSIAMLPRGEIGVYEYVYEYGKRGTARRS
jgi:hypothetical protein